MLPMGPSCADVGGIATIGGSGRRVVGVSRAYGSNSPRLEPGVCVVRVLVLVLVWGSWRAAMCAWCGGGRLGPTGGLRGPFLRTLTRQVAVWARRPHCHLKGPAAQRRASTTTCGAQLRGAGWASYGQPVADLSGAQLCRRGGNCYHRRLWAACRRRVAGLW